jgi:hypothetical protein
MQVKEVRSNSSYLSASDSRAIFGFGANRDPINIEISWPSGLVSRWPNAPIDKFIHIREGETKH